MSESQLNAGQIVHFTHGEYSDYTSSGLCVVVKPFDLAEQLNRFVEAVLKTDEYEHPQCNEQNFIGWLCAQELMVAAEHREIHLGSYGDIEVPGHKVNGYDIDDKAGRLHEAQRAGKDA